MDVAATINGVSYGLLGIALLTAAISDVQKRIIPNWLVASIVALFVLKSVAIVLTGGDVKSNILLPLIGSAGLFMVTLFLFARGVLGGGDTKLLTALGLFTPLTLLLPMVWIMAIVGGAIALATLLIGRIKKTEPSVPYGVAIMVAGLFVCGVKGGLIPAQTALL